ncbi:hypothetical protein QBC32DRAFT_374162 [Pseudoneurospora amorphoporcata]|uniref:Protein kinase domain-containing protein n=1 Tax=Pseudoneurospora amorphoporcata TaxID=241081 RepID=A0AAN6SBK8_9PEZI|nr:hypothetical protein QBC32DRAFT_374162 [Pseudoneurospora amorphoporcata]
MKLVYDPGKPYLCGFGYSRPEKSKTTARSLDTAWDLYRWPAIQREHPTDHNSRKTYDLYSLGLVLLEIGHWKPLDEILLQDSKNARDWLLGTQPNAPFAEAKKMNPLRELRNLMGDRYSRAVERCLDSGVGIRLQEAFTKYVIEELQGVSV